MFLIECEGIQIGELYNADSDGAKRIIIAAIEAGMVITFQKPEPVKQLPAPPTVTPAKQQLQTWQKQNPPKPVKLPPITQKPAPKVTTETPAGSELKVGDRVYLDWAGLSETKQLNYSNKRWSYGVVEQFRTGTGIRSTVGVLFEGDKLTTWWQPRDLTTQPQTQPAN